MAKKQKRNGLLAILGLLGLLDSGVLLKEESCFPQNNRIEEIVEEKREITKEGLGKRPLVYDSLGYESFAEYDFNGVKLADKYSTIGRIQRTLRWQPIYRAVEEKYGIPKDTLAGMIMEESCGDPVQPNNTGDGGLGIVHVQGTTAEQYGLKIYGSSNRASDKSHGSQINKLIVKCDYDPVCIADEDERAHLIKVLDTAGRIVTKGKRIHSEWDFGVEYYRAPGRVGKSTGWKYLNRVQKWQKNIQDPEMLRAAEKDFANRNNEMSFDKYIDRWHEMNGNWGLEKYTNSE